MAENTPHWFNKVIRDVAELPYRDSPPDQPDMMLVTADELRTILQNNLEQIEQEARARTAGDVAMGWNPIETAPKDGTVVDLWIVEPFCEFRAPDFKFQDGRWVSDTSGDPLDRFYANVGMNPTHWMLHPGPPSNPLPRTAPLATPSPHRKS